MKINWKLRLQNKTTILAIVSAIVVFVFSILRALGIETDITQEQVMGGVTTVLTILASLGILIDPTTSGISDSDRALGYDEPAANTTKAAALAAAEEQAA